jgi:hypothetical protein
MMILSGILGQFIGGYLSDFYRKKTITVVTTAGAVPALIAIIVVHGIWLYPLLCIYGFLLWSSY